MDLSRWALAYKNILKFYPSQFQKIEVEALANFVSALQTEVEKVDQYALTAEEKEFKGKYLALKK